MEVIYQQINFSQIEKRFIYGKVWETFTLNCWISYSWWKAKYGFTVSAMNIRGVHFFLKENHFFTWASIFLT